MANHYSREFTNAYVTAVGQSARHSFGTRGTIQTDSSVETGQLARLGVVEHIDDHFHKIFAENIVELTSSAREYNPAYAIFDSFIHELCFHYVRLRQRPRSFAGIELNFKR